MMAMAANMMRGRGETGNAPRSHRGICGFNSRRLHLLLQVAAAAAVALFTADVAQAEELRTEDARVPRSIRGVGTAEAVSRFVQPAEGGQAGVAQLVEHAAHTRAVAGSSPAPGTGAGCMREPASGGRGAGVVQSVEQPPRKRQVAGSMPVAGPAVAESTTGTTTTNGQVPKWPNGTGRNPVGLRAFAGSTPALPTGAVAGGYYRGRVVEVVQAAACKAADAGSSPAASSEPEGFEGCCGAMVERHQHPAVYRETRVRVPLAPLPQAADSDTCALGRHPYAGVAQLVERRLAKAEVAGPNPVSRSSRGAGRGIHARHGWAGVAQLVERRPSKSEAAGSTPVPCSTRSSRSVSSIVVI